MRKGASRSSDMSAVLVVVARLLPDQTQEAVLVEHDHVALWRSIGGGSMVSFRGHTDPETALNPVRNHQFGLTNTARLARSSKSAERSNEIGNARTLRRSWREGSRRGGLASWRQPSQVALRRNQGADPLTCLHDCASYQARSVVLHAAHVVCGSRNDHIDEPLMAAAHRRPCRLR